MSSLLLKCCISLILGISAVVETGGGEEELNLLFLSLKAEHPTHPHFICRESN
jgi:hypothetical protein